MKYNNTQLIKGEWVTTDEVFNVKMDPFNDWTGKGWTSYLNVSGYISFDINKNDFERDDINYINLKSPLLTDVVRVER